MKKFKKLYLLFLVVIAVILTSCSGGEVKIDYADAKSFEEALNNGENLEGKVVQFVADDLKPSSAFGYNIFAGEHLNFVSTRNPDVKKGDIVTVRTTTIESITGSWIINYEKINSVSGADSTDLTSEEVEVQQETTNSDNSNSNNFGTIENDFTEASPSNNSNEEEISTPEKPLEITEYGYYNEPSTYDDVMYVHFYAKVHNPNELIAEFPELTVTITAGDKSILGTEDAGATQIMPNDTGFFYGELSVPIADLTEDTKINFDVDYSSLTDYSYFGNIKCSEIVFSNISEHSTKYNSSITGNVVNNNSEEVFSLRIAIILRKEDKVVYIGDTIVGSLKPNKETPFEYNAFDDLPEYDTIEVYAVS